MSEFRVRWVIDVEAEDADAAAALALEIQRDLRSTATVFEVYDTDGRHKQVDLTPAPAFADERRSC